MSLSHVYNYGQLFLKLKTLMQQIKNKHASTIQMLVQNYLEKENKTLNVYMYSELINDIDAFDGCIRRMATIDEKFKSSIPKKSEPPTIQAFIDLIESDGIHEVKYTGISYIYKFDYILQLICKTRYPKNTKLELILIPTDTKTIDEHNSNVINVSIFNQYKDKLLQFDKQTKYYIFNSLINDSQYKSKTTDEALRKVISLAQSGNIKKTYTHNISDTEYETLEHNFSMLYIRILTISDLLKYPLDEEFICSYLDL